MSETETVRGKLTRVERTRNETIEDLCKRLIGDYDLPLWASNYEEYLRDVDDGYVICNGEVYSITQEDLSADDIFEATQNDDGTIDFLVQYYNGGCGFEEAIEYALKKLDKE